MRKIHGIQKNSKLSTSIQAMGLGKIPNSSPLYIGKGTLKNSKLYRLWDLKKFRSLLLFQIQPVDEAPSEARYKVLLFCLLHVGSGTWKNSILYISISGTGKNSKFSPRLWDLDKYRALPLYISSS